MDSHTNRDISPEERSPETRAELVAAEYLEQLQAGEAPDMDAYAERLAGREREQFEALVQGALSVQGLMPRQVQPGMLLDERYRLFREIGSGGMGKVYEALDTSLQRRVAVKVLTAAAYAGYDPETLFARETMVLAGLQHPNIVAIHEAGSDGDVQYVVMDLVAGTPLDKVLRNVRSALEDSGEVTPRTGALLQSSIGLPLPQGSASILDQGSWFRSAAQLVHTIARTVQAAHGKGIVHRDLKPGNVMLRGDGTPVVLDFGLAGQADTDVGTVTRGLFGSALYLAPEQARSSSSGNDPRTDVYQIGMLLYELLTLKRAFPDVGLSELIEKVARGEFPRPRSLDSGIPFDLEAICLKALELDPNRRYQSASDLADDLERWLADEVPHAARGGALAGAARSTRYLLRRNKMAAVAASLLVAWGAFELMRPPPPDVEITGFHAAAESLEVPRPLAKGDTVRPGDFMGVTVATTGTRFVYAMSVMGTEDEPRQYLRPLRIALVNGGGRIPELEADGLVFGDEYEHTLKGQPDDWGLKLPEGKHPVVCTRLDAEPDPGRPVEGLWVFNSDQRQPEIDRWFGELEYEDERGGLQGVPLAMAWERLDNPPLTRGGALTGLGEEGAEKLIRGLTEAELLGEDDWPLADPKRFELLCVVRVDS